MLVVQGGHRVNEVKAEDQRNDAGEVIGLLTKCITPTTGEAVQFRRMGDGEGRVWDSYRGLRRSKGQNDVISFIGFIRLQEVYKTPSSSALVLISVAIACVAAPLYPLSQTSSYHTTRHLHA